MNLNLIPSADTAPAGAAPSTLVAALRSASPPRRLIFKGLLASAMASALVPLDWFIERRAARAAGPTSEFTSCSPSSYTEQAANWWSGPAICYGGWRRGSYPCASGYHFEGFRSYSDEGYTSNRVTTCGGRNAWRWTYSGRSYRCSDANTTCVWNSGERYTALTIAQCGL
ncbi:hypothetical protein K7640_04565 [Micromonospora sp. PLK6-60]|uniref:hypothetical protein n=1 Tax=Micromonospora sp. PLK6-60 TaxID=2873383 RepID=UPI001CA71762|nr:hypothetical protein [Micromonospora sp. PLK6-60]MBY8871117.1 hypothetical protein [Micromonospora sp. PLK6-60]